MIGDGLRKRCSSIRFDDFRTVDRTAGERLVELKPAAEQLRRPTKDALPAGFSLLPVPTACAGECAGKFHALHEKTRLCLRCLLNSGWTPGAEVESLTNQQRARALRIVAQAWDQPKEDVAAFIAEYALEMGRSFDSVLADFAAECGDHGPEGEREPTQHEKRVYACRLAKLKRLRDELAKEGRPYASAFEHPKAPVCWELAERARGEDPASRKARKAREQAMSLRQRTRFRTMVREAGERIRERNACGGLLASK